ncbi:MAG: TonB-dependent receptor [Methylobacter sp.]|nr:MAG: TonB-dependent receptor [Methylobacter sp.]
MLLFCIDSAHGDQIVNLDEAALLKLFDAKDLVSIASGYKQPLTKAPAVATVITAEDIKAMGATDLDEVLETVPGIHVSRRASGYTPIYSIRGVYSGANPQVLVLINGVSISNLYLGDRNQVWGGMPVQAIARVEVVRGPGSAVYGADAFAGVINIITKTKQDIKGTEVGGRVGSFDTYDGWALHGGTWAGFDVAATLEYHDTQGHKGIVDADAQTVQFDRLFGSHASLAPGPVNLQAQNLDARVDLSREKWRIRAGLQNRGNIGNGAGFAQALDPTNRYASQRWNADLNYDNPDFAEDWNVKAQLSYLDTSQEVESNLTLFPPGARLPIDPATGQLGRGPFVTFPQGYIGNPEIFERHASFNTSAFYTGFNRHTLRIGAGFNYGTLYDAKATENFGINQLTGTANPLLPNFSLINVTGTPANFISTADRKNSFVFLQDEWKFAKDWAFTAGIRYDNYSDFGNTVNPRLALVWEARHNLTTKLLYGSAFRAPSFAELYLTNNPVGQGNPALKPEIMDTVELAFDYRPIDKLRLGLNIFDYWWKDVIGSALATTAMYQNGGNKTGHGAELEMEWKADDTLKFLGNYAYQKSQNKETNHDAGYAPHHQVYVRANWNFMPNWQLTPQAKWIIDRSRTANDNRPAVADYTWVDMTLRRQHIAEHWEVAFSVRNLLDVDARDPSSSTIPNDLPLAGRNFFGEIRVNF